MHLRPALQACNRTRRPRARSRLGQDGHGRRLLGTRQRTPNSHGGDMRRTRLCHQSVVSPAWMAARRRRRPQGPHWRRIPTKATCARRRPHLRESLASAATLGDGADRDHGIEPWSEFANRLGRHASIHAVCRTIRPTMARSCSPDALQALKQQLTPGLVSRCRVFARWCLRRYGLRRAAAYHEELVQDALGDLVEGRIAWAPARNRLADHVCDVIRYRVRDEKRSAGERRAWLPLEGRASSSVLDAEDLRVLTPDALLLRAQAQAVARRVAECLNGLASSDDEVHRVLTCYCAGIDDRQAICGITGMSVHSYHNARRRLVRLADRLPLALRTMAFELADVIAESD